MLAFSAAPAATADPVYTAEWELVGKNFFAKNSHDLTFSAKKKIRKIVRTNPGVEFSITGFAQYSETKNRGYLSKSRALHVKRFIRSLGFEGTVNVKAGWAPDVKGSKDSARRTEIRIKELSTFSLKLNDLYIDTDWICPFAWAVYTGEVTIEDGLEAETYDRMINNAAYNGMCEENYGFELADLEAGTYTVVVGYFHDAYCGVSSLTDADYVGNWQPECYEMLGDEGTYYFYTFELDENLVLNGPDWSGYILEQ